MRPRLGVAARRRLLATSAAGAALLAAAPALAAAGAPGRHGTPLAHVIVTGRPGAERAVVADIRRLDGRVTHGLGVVDGAAADVPVSALPALRRAPGVRAVSWNGAVHFMGVDPTLGYDVTGDDGSLYNIGQVTHAKDAWGARWTGQGVDVALIDSGVTPVQGLTSGNVINGPDLSFESQNSGFAHLDTYGHGTHMASIIVGRDVPESGGDYANAGTHHFHGIAPDARLVSIKVATNSGATDVSQVLAAIDWVVEHAHDPGFNIRVLNLSFGTDSVQDPAVDPLCYAVENAWRAGIVVVVAAGNDGTNRQRLADPAQDPLVLAVGAEDPRGTDSVGDDQVPTFSQLGTSSRRVDLIAPGVHVLGLRDPGSRIDDENPQAVVNDRFFRGSGTSEAAAVVSGLAALYLQKYPNAPADQVKRALMMTAAPPSSVKSTYPGLGVPDINKALGQHPAWTQAPTGATGTGSLEASRGSAHVNDGTSDLTGEQDIFGHAWDGASWATATSAGTAWNGGDWNGTTWSGTTWSGTTWSGNTWSGTTWSGNTWTGTTWSGNTWTGSTWSGNTWTGNTWTGNTWTTSVFATASWS